MATQVAAPTFAMVIFIFLLTASVAFELSGEESLKSKWFEELEETEASKNVKKCFGNGQLPAWNQFREGSRRDVEFLSCPLTSLTSVPNVPAPREAPGLRQQE